MNIRKLTIKDYHELIKLWERAKLPIKPKGRDRKSHVAREMKCNPDFFIGAFDGRLMTGAVIASHDGRKGWLNRIAVDPDYRGRGIAKALTIAGEKTLRRHGIKIFGLLIHEYNKASLSLAQKMGYVPHTDIMYLSKRDGEHI
ncbi:MAG: GNAT family N-acetyltransferase [Candidatus Edwardsbacteria bacterium]|nr:GNAT family N-acetyltransferase [Candidatus Edwardsbacteria bacterium]